MTQRDGGHGATGEQADDAADLAPGEEIEDETDPGEDAGDEGEIAGQSDEPAHGDASEGAPAEAVRTGRRGARRADAAGRPAPAPTTSELAVRIDDRISVIFVVVTVAFFVLVFAYALLFGGSGALTPKPTPRPTPVPTASASPSESPSAAPSDSAAPSASPAPSAPATLSPSAAPSPSPSST